MNDRRLPDDPRQWPDDPYELLGVAPGVSPRDLKRAYTALIRVYKPEQSPEQFRRVRAAYEHVLRVAEFAERFGVRIVPAGESEAVAEGVAADGAAPIAVSRPAVEPRRTADDPASVAWEWAVAGDLPRSYAALADLQRTVTDRADLSLRLFWLLALDPTLDPVRPAATWLVEALTRSGLTGPALELYRQELDERPAEALDAGAALLTAPASAARLADVAEARLWTAGRLRRWDIIRADLDRVRDRLSQADESAWVRLQFAAIDNLAWWFDFPEPSALYDDCRAEIDRHPHLGVRLGPLFDRLESLLPFAAGWRKLRHGGRVPEEFLEVVRRAWNEPFPAVRPLLLQVMNQMTAQPREWLAYLATAEAASPAVLYPFAAVLGQYQDRLPEPPAAPHPPDVLGQLAADFFDAAPEQMRGVIDYSALRPRLLDFCLAEAVGPEWLAPVVPSRSAYWLMQTMALADALANDWPMRLVCWAVRLFWA